MIVGHRPIGDDAPSGEGCQQQPGSGAAQHGAVKQPEGCQQHHEGTYAPWPDGNEQQVEESQAQGEVCSFVADHIDGAMPHINARDITVVVCSRAPSAQIEPFRRRMGWRFKWVSSNRSDFNSDYHVSFTKDDLAKGPTYYNFEKRASPSEGEAPGLSVFYKDETGEIFHTYSAYARGLEVLDGAYHFIDLAPKGRDEEGLPWRGAWWRHHDRYASDTIQARHAE